MTHLIQHRVNKITDLQKLNPALGCEIDLRSDLQVPGRLHLSHDAWVKGDDFGDWLKIFHQKGMRGPLILNTKEDGLESRILELIRHYSIQNYFFLDTALPTLVRWTTKDQLRNFAIRYSSYEPQEFVTKFKGLVDWCWVDCFGKVPVATQDVNELRKAFKVCLVSPELQGGTAQEIAAFKSQFRNIDAVCTKDPDSWK